MKQRGFTLVELVITIAIAGAVLTIGIPYFQETIRQNRLTAYTNQFVGALNLARSEAIKRGRRVVLCPSTDGAACAATGDYEQGWMVFADTDADNTVDVGEIIIRVFEKMPEGMTLQGSSAQIQSAVFYTPDGVSSVTAGNTDRWTVCNHGKAREITISTIGRITVIAEPASPTCP